jgi:murein DD-endopeptidase MepM/ murein hydrolase activator NlpD
MKLKIFLSFIFILVSSLLFANLNLKAEELSKDEQKQLQNYKNLTKWIIDNKTNFDPLMADTKKKSHTKWIVEPNQNDNITQAGYVEHRVAKGETIYYIAKKYGVLEVDVLKWNNLASVNDLKTNNVLKIFIGAKNFGKNIDDKSKTQNAELPNKENLLIAENQKNKENKDLNTKPQNEKKSDENANSLDMPVIGANTNANTNVDPEQGKALNKDLSVNPVITPIPMPNNNMNLNVQSGAKIEEKNLTTNKDLKSDVVGKVDPVVVKDNNEEEFPQFKYYKVKKGDTISSISKANFMTNNELILMNNIKPPYELTLDTLLKVKSNYKEQAGHSNTGSSLFEWPVVGRLLIGFGPQSGGVTNEGINISAKKGTFIKATQNGVVIYIGNDLDSFGNIILLQHNNGWVSAYAHVENIKVKKGEHVAQSQIIADVGTSGGVSQPQLHFELRQNVKPMDPLLYLNSHR